MMRRRDVLIGAGCLLTAGAATALRPRTRVTLLNGGEFEQIIPKQFAGWRHDESQALIVPEDENSLASQLYNQVVARLYLHPRYGHAMVLVAYGDTQTDLLQLHRPEACYPAFGFEVTEGRNDRVLLKEPVSIPVRELTAVGPSRTEHITYWVRMGEYLPADSKEQRIAKLETQLQGIIPDGVLVRISNLEENKPRAFRVNAKFAADMLMAIRPSFRPSLIGTANARQLA